MSHERMLVSIPDFYHFKVYFLPNVSSHARNFDLAGH